MACNCRRGRKPNAKYVWTSPSDDQGKTETITYDSEIQAKARVLRRGGSYSVKPL